MLFMFIFFDWKRKLGITFFLYFYEHIQCTTAHLVIHNAVEALEANKIFAQQSKLLVWVHNERQTSQKLATQIAVFEKRLQS